MTICDHVFSWAELAAIAVIISVIIYSWLGVVVATV